MSTLLTYFLTPYIKDSNERVLFSKARGANPFTLDILE
jgi:hypothetical protein